ncbi:hypothetical protein GH733_008939 [Mirounga leonina]|nr:hypothetical protein GH733_008939 [Mirounga leonina]
MHPTPSIHTRENELHTLKVTGQETVAQIKAQVASLEGTAPQDQVVFLAGTSLEDEATLGQCGVEALTTVEVAGRRLGAFNSKQKHEPRDLTLDLGAQTSGGPGVRRHVRYSG